MRKPWQTKEWRERRAEFIKGKCCEWCGSTEYLTIDHLKNVYQNFEYGKVAFQYFIQYFQNEEHVDELKHLKKRAIKTTTLYYCNACPKCGYSLSVRKKLKPKYRCYRCNMTFSQPKKKLKISTINFLRRRVFQFFKEKHKEEIDAIAIPKIQQLNEDYFAFKDVLILCRRCAFARLKGMHLCPKCKKKYIPARFTVCFDCLPSEVKERIQKLKEEQEELEREDEEESEYEMRLAYCGNCKHLVEINQEYFCGLSPDEMCDYGLFEEGGIRRYKRGETKNER